MGQRPLAGLQGLALANLARRTLHPEDQDGLAGFLGQQFWYDNATQKLWWDLDSVFQRLRESCHKLQKKYDWLKVVGNRASLDLAIAPPFLHAPTNELNRWVCTTVALHTFLFVTCDECKSHEEAKYVQDAYAGLLQRSIAVIREPADGQVIVGHNTLTIDRGGQVTGFKQHIESQHASIHKMLLQEWSMQHEAGILSSSIDRETLSLLDVVTFVMTLGRRRRLRMRPLSKYSRRFMDTIRRALIPWSTRMADRWVLAKYLNDQKAAERPAPALVWQRPGKRKYSKVSAEAAWALIEKARKGHVDLRHALWLCSDQADLGCNEFEDSVWIHKLLAMYYKRSTMPFAAGVVNHYCFVSDPGTHAYKDCLVSMVWSWELQLGAYPIWQVLKPGKEVLKGEANMDTALETFRQRKKLERVAAYRQVQGLSHQLFHLTNKRCKIDVFKLPQEAHVRPVEEDETPRAKKKKKH